MPISVQHFEHMEKMEVEDIVNGSTADPSHSAKLLLSKSNTLSTKSTKVLACDSFFSKEFPSQNNALILTPSATVDAYKRIISEEKKWKDICQKTQEISNNIQAFLTNTMFIYQTPLDQIKKHQDFEKYLSFSITADPSSYVPSVTEHSEVATDCLEILMVGKAQQWDIPPPPPNNIIERPKPISGSRLYAMRTTTLDAFVEGTVLSVNNVASEALYKVRFNSTKTIESKFLSLKQLAYLESPKYRLPVGTRIVANYEGEDSGVYAGIIAELPNSANKARYLIFFDDGYAQYINCKDVFLVCAQSIDVAHDVDVNIKDFIQGYLSKYPERPMVKLQKNQIIKTEFCQKWWDTRVVEVDSSMVKLYFLTSGRYEWLYRGSTRFRPLYNEITSAEYRRGSGKYRKHNLQVRRPHEPYVEYTREDSVIPTIDLEEEDSTPGRVQHKVARRRTGGSRIDVEKPVRNTARKSTAGKPPEPKATNSVPNYAPDIKSHTGYKDFHQLTSYSRTRYRSHTCSSSCRERIDPGRYKGKNPLQIPIHLGWERQVRKFKKKTHQMLVTYRTSCGRHLRNIAEINQYLQKIDSRLTIDFFSTDAQLNPFRSFRPSDILYEDKDITKGKENIPISCVNVHTEDSPPAIEYASERFARTGVPLNTDRNFLVGCSCIDDCRSSARCECQQITNYAAGTPAGTTGYKYRRLKETIVTGIYECNQNCKCSPKCDNRVIQNGLQVRLQMFKTQHKGWGIRCLDDLDAGMFICIYAGQLLTEQDAETDGITIGDEYLAELDHIEVVENIKEGYESDVAEIETMDVDNESSTSEKTTSENKTNDSSSISSDQDMLADESDSDFETNLFSTALPSYKTRSNRKDSTENTTVSNSSQFISNNANSNELPEISSSLDHDLLSQQPLSPETERFVDNAKFTRTPNLAEDTNFTGGRAVAKKSFSAKSSMNTRMITENSHQPSKSLRSYYGESSLYIMDAKTKGNIGRYLNHSCSPNVFVQNVFVRTHDLRFPEVAFFAAHRIIAGTELTWDYNYEIDSVQGKHLRCYCDSRYCRQRLL